MTPFQKLDERMQRRAHELAVAARERAEAEFAAVPDVVTKQEGENIIIQAKGLLRRWLSEPTFRFGLWRSR